VCLDVGKIQSCDDTVSSSFSFLYRLLPTISRHLISFKASCPPVTPILNKLLEDQRHRRRLRHRFQLETPEAQKVGIHKKFMDSFYGRLGGAGERCTSLNVQALLYGDTDSVIFPSSNWKGKEVVAYSDSEHNTTLDEKRAHRIGSYTSSTEYIQRELLQGQGKLLNYSYEDTPLGRRRLRKATAVDLFGVFA